MSTSLPRDALGAAVLKTLAEEVKAAADGGKNSLLGIMGELKIKSLVAELPDGTQVATVTRAGGGTRPKVKDPDKFRAWVAGSHPDEIVTTVRDTYARALLDSIAGTGNAVDPDTGEVVPGVEFESGNPYLLITFAKGETGGQELIRRAWRTGQISLDSLLAIEGGEPDA